MSAHEVGAKYRDGGKHELALQYFVQAHLSAADDVNVHADMMASFEKVNEILKGSLLRAKTQNDPITMLKLATRLEELSRWAYLMKLTPIDDDTGAALVAEIYPKARAQTLALVDEAESNDTAHRVLVVRLRRALALDPDNPELDARYHALMKNLRRHISTQITCDNTPEGECDAALHATVEHLNHVRREFFDITSARSNDVDARLSLVLTEELNDCQWTQVDAGTGAEKVPRTNRFNEPEKDAKGRQVYDTVKANWAVHACTTRAQATAQLTVEDLRPDSPSLFKGEAAEANQDGRTYVHWRGDMRAVPGSAMRAGTNRQAPAPARALVRRARSKVVAKIAKQMISVIETVNVGDMAPGKTNASEWETSRLQPKRDMGDSAPRLSKEGRSHDARRGDLVMRQ